MAGTFDIVGSIALVVLFAPVMLLSALAIKHLPAAALVLLRAADRELTPPAPTSFRRAWS